MNILSFSITMITFTWVAAQNSKGHSGIPKPPQPFKGDVNPSAYYEEAGPFSSICPLPFPARPYYSYTDIVPSECFVYVNTFNPQSGLNYPSCISECANPDPHLKGFRCFRTPDCQGPETFFPGEICLTGFDIAYLEYCPGYVAPLEPSSSPTSAVPSRRPTFAVPSSGPTFVPSSGPTFVPSSGPTFVPSRRPTFAVPSSGQTFVPSQNQIVRGGGYGDTHFITFSGQSFTCNDLGSILLVSEGICQIVANQFDIGNGQTSIDSISIIFSSSPPTPVISFSVVSPITSTVIFNSGLPEEVVVSFTTKTLTLTNFGTVITLNYFTTFLDALLETSHAWDSGLFVTSSSCTNLDDATTYPPHPNCPQSLEEPYYSFCNYDMANSGNNTEYLSSVFEASNFFDPNIK